jgi:hypothetical protein
MKWGPAAGSLCALCIFVLLSLELLPAQASAQVVINEVMYNPAGSDAGREWVELYNKGQSDVTMVGGSGKGSWRLNDGSNHTLTDPSGGTGRGSLIVPAGGYLIVANDPNDFISGEYAGGSYSVVKSSLSLNNNGATLTLLDGTGATVDTVSYAPSQGGNDDGSSLQRQADGSWIAALPTPGAANSLVPYVAPVVDNDQTSTSPPSDQSDASSTDGSQTQTAATQSSYVAPPAPILYADAEGASTVIVGADVEFDASAYDKDQDVIDPSTVRFLWNFGDGSTAEGPAVLHHFSYPGRYAVDLEIADNKNAAGDEIIVTADPAALSFSLLPDGGTRIENLAGHDLDLSSWIVREGAGSFAAQFILPEHSKILTDSAMEIPPQTLSFRASSSTMLEYPNGALALAMGENSAASTTPQHVQEESIVPPDPPPRSASAPTAPPEPSETSSVVEADPDDVSSSDATDTDTEALDVPTSPTPTILQTAAAASSPASNYFWWFGVAALALAALAAVIAATHFKKGEWDIVEDKPE